MKSLLKIVLASIIGGTWYTLNGVGSEVVSVGIFVLILFVFFIRPISFQTPERREEYIQRLKTNYERKMALQNKQKEEQLRLTQAKKERENKKRKELKEQIKKYQ
ncbi:hypothetical protein [Helicobacter cetorum]|uniref:Integral membrane protein n=1 Tax=Helicobacter cetorum (strain ATCC BAA-429 / MIT 00-7128) TaxID=182217 RepID=I0EP64_HELC0|nr:hypothetical protein [Helicobacter cetorum]AFI04733.1 integral membrane protein [Helicobacter cetorum MIT 00-7128]